MSRGQGRTLCTSYLIAIIAVLTGLFAVNAHAQYNGECWAADYYNVFKIASSGQPVQIQGFSQPLSLAINPKDGSCWVANTDAILVMKISAAGDPILTINSQDQPQVFKSQPASVAVDPRDGSCWVGVRDTVYKFSSDAKQLAAVPGFNEPILAVNPKNGECWIADSSNARIVRLSADGAQLGAMQIDGVTQPKSISINPNDGICWVLDAFTCKVVKLSPDFKILKAGLAVPTGTAIMSTSLSASSDGGCWVAVMIDMMNDTVLKLSSDLTQVMKVDGFGMPSGLAADPNDGGCWVADTNGGQIVKIAANGQKTAVIQGLSQPKVVSVAHPVK